MNEEVNGHAQLVYPQNIHARSPHSTEYKMENPRFIFISITYLFFMLYVKLV